MEKIVDDVNVLTYENIYKTMDHDHAYPNTNLVRLEKWFLKMPGKVLDHGCGYGENLIFLTTRGYAVTGIDISNDLIDFVKLKCKLRKVPETLYSLEVIGDIYKLPYKDEYFDHIISLGVIQYLASRESVSSCIKEFIRCLKPKGRMIISTFAPENTYVVNGDLLGNEQYHFQGSSPDKGIPLDWKLYVPDTAESYKSIFPAERSFFGRRAFQSSKTGF